jgi:penicillin amidase
MQLTRLLAQGRICELAGAKALPLDIRMRTIGLHRLAKKQAAMLGPEYRKFFQRYVEGVNAFIKYCPDDLPLEFKLAGIKAEPWTVADSLSVLYYMGFATSANLNHEITAQMLVEKLGPQKAAELMPININPDDPGPARRAAAAPSASAPGLLADSSLLGFLGGMPLRLGSNNWALAPRLTGGKGAVLAGDPHIKTDILPGGEAWLRVHAVNLSHMKDLKPPILYNIKNPEHHTKDIRWQYVRNTPFRKTIETIGSILGDIVTVKFFTDTNWLDKGNHHKKQSSDG